MSVSRPLHRPPTRRCECHSCSPVPQARSLIPRHRQQPSTQEKQALRVCSDLASSLPVGTAELEAVEMYLSDQLDELFDCARCPQKIARDLVCRCPRAMMLP